MSISDEFEFIKSIEPSTLFHRNKVVGIGDDAAIIGVDSKFEKVVCVDTMVEEIHFSAQTMEPFDIGYKALAANISDVAAMGGIPLYYLVSITIPTRWAKKDLVAIYDGMRALGDQYKMDLIGGDTTSGSSLVLSVFVIGKVETGKRLLRSNARNGDIVFVSGSLGESAAGLDLLLKNVAIENQEKWKQLVSRHKQPSPKVSLGRVLAGFERVALNDVSDGLASELIEITEASNVDIMINKDTIPIDPILMQYNPKNALTWALTGGEDFELVGTISPADWPFLQKQCKELEIVISAIGKVADGDGKVFMYDEHGKVELKKEGFNHFQKE
ncbi:thiamine-phosphate kinase [Sutcliffiella deserti]|uniref:thiamine-phosphate kinase n=1 Tax=Sutcliffiella deserti TaxID=2875501 RepID=UPI001CC121EC|nr:thiamine-phosphate kinase [Sutcliffiella deserti]